MQEEGGDDVENENINGDKIMEKLEGGCNMVTGMEMMMVMIAEDETKWRDFNYKQESAG